MPDDREIFFARLREKIGLEAEQKLEKLKSKDDSELKTKKKVNILDLDDDEKIKTKSKDDFDTLKTKNKKLKEEFSKNVVIKKICNDDTDLLLMAQKLKNTKIGKMENSEIYEYADNLKYFFKSSMSKTQDKILKKPMNDLIRALNQIPKNIDLKKTKAPEEFVNKLTTSIKKINERVRCV